MKTLIIDTSDNKQISIGLRIDNKEYIKRQKVDKAKAQGALPMIEKIISEKDLSLKDLDSIEVNTGPGSFTGIRVGVSIANALSFVLKIPINGKPLVHFVEPRYS